MNVPLFFGRQIISHNKGVVLVTESGKFTKYQIKLSYCVPNLPFVTESNFTDCHLLINDAFHNCQQ